MRIEVPTDAVEIGWEMTRGGVRATSRGFAESSPTSDDLQPLLLTSLPERFTVHFEADDLSLPWDVTLVLSAPIRGSDLAPGDPGWWTFTVDEMTIRRRAGGPPASAAGVRRVPIGRLVDIAIQSVMRTREAVLDADGRTVLLEDVDPSQHPDEPLTPAERKAIVRSAADEFKQGRRRNEVTPQQRADVLATYERLKEADVKDPFQAAGEVHGIARSTAHAWVSKARKEASS